MLGVDRLDMIKGIPQKILAFEKFLEENSHWRDKVVLLQIAVPTRTDVPECMISNTLDTVPYMTLVIIMLAFQTDCTVEFMSLRVMLSHMPKQYMLRKKRSGNQVGSSLLSTGCVLCVQKCSKLHCLCYYFFLNDRSYIYIFMVFSFSIFLYSGGHCKLNLRSLWKSSPQALQLELAQAFSCHSKGK
jgi:hypothetical protein